MVRRAALTIGGLLLAAIPAKADRLPIDGVYADEAGCAFHRDGTVLTDGFFIVTDTQVRGYDSFCEIVGVTGDEKNMTIRAACSSEGEVFANTFAMTKGQGDTYQFGVAEVDFRFTLSPCN